MMARDFTIWIGLPEHIDRELYARRPMLAQVMPHGPGGFDPTGWWLSEKLDGCRALWHGEHGELLTRSGSLIEAPDWFTASLRRCPHDLDGELVSPRGFDCMSELVRGVRGQDDAAWRDVRYMLFDAPSVDGPFEQRIRFAEGFCAGTAADHVQVLAQRRIHSRRDLDRAFTRILNRGGEGVMLRAPGSEYVAGRSPLMLKRKPIADGDGMVNAINLRRDGTRRSVRLMLADGREMNLAVPKRIRVNVGDLIAFRYSGVTSGGLPRFARFAGIRAD